MCGVASSFVQQTVVPTGTVNVSGSYAKLMMLTGVEPVGHPPDGFAFPLPAGPLPTSTQSAAASVAAATNRPLMAPLPEVNPLVPYAKGGNPVFGAGTSGPAPNLDP